MIVDDDAAAKALGQVAAFGRHPIRGQGRGRGGMQPLALAGDPKAGFVEMAHGGLGCERGDPRRDSPEFLGLPLAPGDDAVGTKPRRAEQIGHRLRHPVLGKELLHIEIDRRRSDARAILSRRDHPLRERRRGLAAAVGAAINHRLVFGDLQARLGQIERLPLLNSGDHRPRQPGQAMATRLRLVPLDCIGLGRRLQRAAGMSRLPAARFPLAARAAGDPRRLLAAAWAPGLYFVPRGGTLAHDGAAE